MALNSFFKKEDQLFGPWIPVFKVDRSFKPLLKVRSD